MLSEGSEVRVQEPEVSGGHKAEFQVGRHTGINLRKPSWGPESLLDTQVCESGNPGIHRSGAFEAPMATVEGTETPPVK